MIAMPGFVDTHRHMWQGSLRNILPNGLLSDYGRDITGSARRVYRPEDAYIGDLVIALGAINAGVTTVLDWSHIGNSPEHTDAAIDGLAESGLRSVYAYGGGVAGPDNRYPDDIRRLRAERFSSDDQLLTLAMAAGTNTEHWAVAREVGAPITLHVNGSGQLLPLADAMGPDVTYIHAPHLTEEEWRLVVDTGGHISIAAPIEMEMGHGIPPIQQALDHGIRPSLSTDVETEMPGDFFTQMQSVFTLQRMQALARRRDGDPEAPELISVQGRRRIRDDSGRHRQRPRIENRQSHARQAGRRHPVAQGRDQRHARQQCLRRSRARHGYEQRRYGVHRGASAQVAGRAHGCGISAASSGSSRNRATMSSPPPAGRRHCSGDICPGH